MSDSVFADGIGEITVTAGVVRIEFVTLSLNRQLSAKPEAARQLQPARTVTVAMPISGFVGSLKTIDDFKQKLVDGGLLKIKPDPVHESSAATKSSNGT